MQPQLMMAATCIVLIAAAGMQPASRCSLTQHAYVIKNMDPHVPLLHHCFLQADASAGRRHDKSHGTEETLRQLHQPEHKIDYGDQRRMLDEKNSPPEEHTGESGWRSTATVVHCFLLCKCDRGLIPCR